MEPLLTSVITAFVTGAATKTASQAVSDAYVALKSFLVRKLDSAAVVQDIEHEPASAPAQAALACALAEYGLHKDDELQKLTIRLERAIAEITASGNGNINIGHIRGKVNTLVEGLVATGSIRLSQVVAEQGDATVRNLHAGSVLTARGHNPKN